MPTSDFDFSIIGAGTVGLISAIAMSRLGFSIAIIDPYLNVKSSVSRDISLNLNSINFIKKILYLEQQEIYAFDSIMNYFNKVSVKFHTSEAVLFESDKLKLDYMGAITEESKLKDFLLDIINENKLISLYDNALLDIKTHENKLILNNGSTITYKLLIGADGKQSRVKQLLNISSEHYAYNQTAMVLRCNTQVPHHNIARQYFTTEGILALLPLSDPNQVSIVFSQSDLLHNVSINQSEDLLLRKLGQLSNYELGFFTSLTKIGNFKLTTTHATNYIKYNAILAGDSAHSIHPLAGMGLNIGIRDIEYLYELLQASIDNFSDKHILRKYERYRKLSNSLVLHSMTVINDLFGVESVLGASAMSFGPKLLNKMQWLKTKLMQAAIYG